MSNYKEQDDLQVGTLVTLKDYCRNSGRLALITERRYGDHCLIQYIDTLNVPPTPARLSNLRVIDFNFNKKNYDIPEADSTSQLN
jgi:hypothetical protein